MLDVVLYGYDGRGLLTLQEASFANLRELAVFFDSPEASQWEWAEVESLTGLGGSLTAHYSADTLRGMVVLWSLSPSAN